MTDKFPLFEAPFVGRDDYITRFRARLAHFRFSIYVGLPGIGKTALLLRLARQVEHVGLERGIYLPLFPGEGIQSILARVEVRLLGRAGFATGAEGDLYRCLASVLSQHKTVLLLDNLDVLHREDLTVMIRTVSSYDGNYRILGAMGVQPDLSAMDRAKLHLELVRPLGRAQVKELATHLGVEGEALERLTADAARGGSAGHPLSVVTMCSVLGNQLPEVSFFKGLTARSITSVKAIWQIIKPQLTEQDLALLRALKYVDLPLPRKEAVRCFGAGIEHLIEKRLLDVYDGEVVLHSSLKQVLDDGPSAVTAQVIKKLTQYLHQRTIKLSEPIALIRAAQLLAHGAEFDLAIETLAEGWESVRDHGFLTSYLKALSTIAVTGIMADRAQVLAVRARMRQGSPGGFIEEMQRLAKVDDTWTQCRALAGLVYLHYELSNYQAVFEAFEALEKVTQNPELSTMAGSLAAESLVSLGRISEAETLALRLLKMLKRLDEPEKQARMHRLVARVCAHGGRLAEAVSQAEAAAKSFEQVGDYYHAATAFGFVGDVYREQGEFEKARKAFQAFLALAQRWGDRDLIHIAELSEAWIMLDIGDISYAGKLVEGVEKELTSLPSRRLKRYLRAAQGLLEIGRGLHAEAAVTLGDVVDSWVSAGQHAIADKLRAQQVRCLLATGELKKAQSIIDKSLERLDPKTDAPRVAVFLREGALINLRNNKNEAAMKQLDEACQLFAQGGNRREEAMTLHRIAHAALDVGDVALAAGRAKACLALADKIQHTRAHALAREVQGRIALIEHDFPAALEACKEASTELKQLGDDLGTLHVNELLLRAYVAAGDMSSVMRLGPRVVAHAEKAGVREVRVRAIVLTGVALLRKGRPDAAVRCFRELPEDMVSPLTMALMWRLGAGLAAVMTEEPEQAEKLIAERTARWVKAVRKMPPACQPQVVDLLSWLGLPPRKRFQLYEDGNDSIVSAEYLSWRGLDTVSALLDFVRGCVREGEHSVAFESDPACKMLLYLVRAQGHVVASKVMHAVIFGEDVEYDKKQQKLLEKMFSATKKQMKQIGSLTFEQTASGFRLKIGKQMLVMMNLEMAFPELNETQHHILRYLGRELVASLPVLQEVLSVSRNVLRQELSLLLDKELVEVVREGRSQAYRLV